MEPTRRFEDEMSIGYFPENKDGRSMILRSDDLRELIRKLAMDAPFFPGDAYTAPPFTLNGMPIIVSEPRYAPKIKLRESVPVTDAFRSKFDAWLQEMFGQRDDSIIPKGMAYMISMPMMKPEHCVRLINCAT
jgi:hypothetical protein